MLLSEYGFRCPLCGREYILQQEVCAVTMPPQFCTECHKPLRRVYSAHRGHVEDDGPGFVPTGIGRDD